MKDICNENQKKRIEEVIESKGYILLEEVYDILGIKPVEHNVDSDDVESL